MEKVILITGGSCGIGAATAKLAAVQGYAVYVNYLQNQSAAEAVVSEIQAESGKAIAVAADDLARIEWEKLIDDLRNGRYSDEEAD